MALLISIFMALGIISSPAELTEKVVLENQQILNENEINPDMHEF